MSFLLWAKLYRYYNFLLTVTNNSKPEVSAKDYLTLDLPLSSTEATTSPPILVIGSEGDTTILFKDRGDYITYKVTPLINIHFQRLQNNSMFWFGENESFCRSDGARTTPNIFRISFLTVYLLQVAVKLHAWVLVLYAKCTDFGI